MNQRERGRSVVEEPDDLSILLTRDFDAPVALVFEAFWRPEYMRRTIAPFGEEVTRCDVDLRVGGGYHYVFVPDGGPECSFLGRFLEVDAPHRTVQTWHFEGWPDVEAVETMDLAEHAGGTRLTWLLRFADAAGRARMGTTEGAEANFDHVEDLLWELQEAATSEA